jgi:hypothetical protein
MTAPTHIPAQPASHQPTALDAARGSVLPIAGEIGIAKVICRLAKNLPSIPLSPPASFGFDFVVNRALPCTWHFVQRRTDDEPEAANLLNILPPPFCA